MGGRVDIRVEVVGCLVAENEQRVQCFTLNGRYRARELGTAWPLKMRSRECQGSMLSGVNTKVEVVGHQVTEIEQGWGVCPAKLKTERRVLSIWWGPHKSNQGGGA